MRSLAVLSAVLLTSPAAAQQLGFNEVVTHIRVTQLHVCAKLVHKDSCMSDFGALVARAYHEKAIYLDDPVFANSLPKKKSPHEVARGWRERLDELIKRYSYKDS
jgi:hypothetical protein